MLKKVKMKKGLVKINNHHSYTSCYSGPRFIADLNKESYIVTDIITLPHKALTQYAFNLFG